jgi:cysteine-rich repeat protein
MARCDSFLVLPTKKLEDKGDCGSCGPGKFTETAITTADDCQLCVSPYFCPINRYKKGLYFYWERYQPVMDAATGQRTKGARLFCPGAGDDTRKEKGFYGEKLPDGQIESQTRTKPLSTSKAGQTTSTVGAASDNDCMLDICGDGLRRHQEECDDGNLDDGDGCTNGCKLEQGFYWPETGSCIPDPKAAMEAVLASLDARRRRLLPEGPRLSSTKHAILDPPSARDVCAALKSKDECEDLDAPPYLRESGCVWVSTNPFEQIARRIGIRKYFNITVAEVTVKNGRSISVDTAGLQDLKADVYNMQKNGELPRGLGGQFARLLPGYVCKDGPSSSVSDTAIAGTLPADAEAALAAAAKTAAVKAAACEAVKVGHCSDPRAAMCGYEAPPKATQGMSLTLFTIRGPRHFCFLGPRPYFNSSESL